MCRMTFAAAAALRAMLVSDPPGAPTGTLALVDTTRLP
jgi:hypothetical protein